MQSMRRLNGYAKELKAMTTIKRWMWVFAGGLTVGMLIGVQSAYWSIIKDCQVMGMFRYGDAPMSCTYHLINLPVYDSIPVEKPKEKKK